MNLFEFDGKIEGRGENTDTALASLIAGVHMANTYYIHYPNGPRLAVISENDVLVLGRGSSLRPHLHLEFNLKTYEIEDRMNLFFQCGTIELKEELVCPLFQETVNAIPTSGHEAKLSLIGIMDGRVLDKLEAERNGKSLIFQWKLSFQVYAEASPNPLIVNALGTFRVAQSDWVENVLAGLGYGEYLLVELPTPSIDDDRAAGGVKRNVEAARKHLANGEYQDVLIACRRSIEEYFKILGYNNLRKDSWEDLIASCRTQEIADRFSKAFQAWFALLNIGGHQIEEPPLVTDIHRCEALAGLRLTVTLLSYIGEIVPRNVG